MYSNVIVGIDRWHGSLLVCYDVESLAVGAFDLINCSLSVVEFVPVYNFGQQVF